MDNQNNKIEDKAMYQTGEKVHEGFYCCCNCQKQDSAVHMEEGEKLSKCKNCGFTTWYKI